MGAIAAQQCTDEAASAQKQHEATNKSMFCVKNPKQDAMSSKSSAPEKEGKLDVGQWISFVFCLENLSTKRRWRRPLERRSQHLRRGAMPWLSVWGRPHQCLSGHRTGVMLCSCLFMSKAVEVLPSQKCSGTLRDAPRGYLLNPQYIYIGMLCLHLFNGTSTWTLEEFLRITTMLHCIWTIVD